MIQLLLVIAACCTIAIVLGRVFRRARWLGVIGATSLTYLASLMLWWYALYFQLVPVYPSLARLGIHRTEGALGALIFLGPPLLPTLLVLLLAFRDRRRERRRPPHSVNPAGRRSGESC